MYSPVRYAQEYFCTNNITILSFGLIVVSSFSPLFRVIVCAERHMQEPTVNIFYLIFILNDVWAKYKINTQV